MESAGRPERRSLNSRSLIASTLLGRHPATLSGKLLVALGELFGIAPGTTRVALSRMVRNGELTNDDGLYTLAGALAQRQQRQDDSRVPGTSREDSWDQSWEQWVVGAEARSADERANLRTAATALKLAELRDGVWLRPANLPTGRLAAATAIMAAQADRLISQPEQPEAMAQTLWDLAGWAQVAEELLADIEADPVDELPESFGLAAEVVRHLLHDPALPEELLPASWPGSRLRVAYDLHEQRMQESLRAFYRSHSQ